MTDVPSPLMRQTLLDRELVRPIDRPVIRMLPWLDVVAIGGHAIFDKGRDALLPLADELRALLPGRKLLMLTGSGIRGRHVMSVGYDLGLPTGVVASLASVEAEQNGQLLAALLAADGVSYVSHATVAHQLAGHLATAPAVVSSGYPPYGLHEFPPEEGALPVHRSDAGAFLLADAYGARNLVYVKDEEGADALDPLVRELLTTAKHTRAVRVVNGLEPGAVTAALTGGNAGTLVEA